MLLALTGGSGITFCEQHLHGKLSAFVDRRLSEDTAEHVSDSLMANPKLPRDFLTAHALSD